MRTFGPVSKSGDRFASEVVINEIPCGARNLLTKGSVQDEIGRRSGAAISTRGRYAPGGEAPDGRPLYLFVRGPTKHSVEAAMRNIEEIIEGDASDSGGRAEKVYVGLDGAPDSFRLRNKIIGQGGSNLRYIRAETGATVTLRGRGSRGNDCRLDCEPPEPMHLLIEHASPEGLAEAKRLAVNLIETLVEEARQITTDSQMPDHPPPSMDAPPPPLPRTPSLPPPGLFTTAPPISGPPPKIENSQISNDDVSDLERIRRVGNLQLQSMGQLCGLGLVRGRPPPLARAPIVSIPPPGVHIPQHRGPMVPPPNVVRLTAPPPPIVASSGTVISVPPPSRSLYLSSDLTACSSGTFSFMQGGVLYHQAPPVQTQAQIGDGLHTISAPPQNTHESVNISLNSHVQPPPHMIITQVHLDSNNQDCAKQIFQQNAPQQPKTQYVIGHIQGAISQEHARSQSNVESFTHFTVNSQSSVPASMIFTVPYHVTGSINTSCTTTIPASQIHQMAAVSHASIIPIQCNDPPITVQITSDQNRTVAQAPLERIILAQASNNPTIISQLSHVPQTQLINQLTPGQIQNNTYVAGQPGPQLLINQQINRVMVSQHELAQVIGNPNQLNRLPPVPINQLPPPPTSQLHPASTLHMTLNSINQSQHTSSHVPPNQMSQDQMNQHVNMQQAIQPQLQRQPTHYQTFNNTTFEHQDNRGILNQGGRNRMISRINRQTYPWNKNDQEKSKYQNNDSNWQSRETERHFEYEKKTDDYNSDNRLRGQQGNESAQTEDRKQRNNQDREMDKGKSFSSGTQRNYQYEKHEGKSSESSNPNWKRLEKHDHDDNMGESNRKRKYDSENNWKSRSENGPLLTSSDKLNIHKSRFEPEDSMMPDAGFQQKQSIYKTSSSKIHGLCDQTKPDMDNSSKWLEQSGESARCGQNDIPGDKCCDISRNLDQCANQIQSESNIENHNDQFSNNLQINQSTSWSDEQTDFKPTIQYATAGQLQIQNINERDKAFNSGSQTNYVNTVQMFQNNIPYLLPPPPPPPHTQPQNNIQYEVQFNIPPGNTPSLITTAPPNIQVNTIGQPISIQNAISNINQNSNIVSSMSSHLVSNLPLSIPNPMNQNVPFEISQNIISNVSQAIPTNNSQPISSSISQSLPSGMTQNVQAVAQHLTPLGIQTQPTVAQILPSSIGQGVVANIGQGIPPNIIPNITQNLPPFIAQSIANNVSQAIPHQIGQTITNVIGQSITSQPNLNLQTIMNPNIQSNIVANIPTMIGTNTTNVSHALPMSVSNSIGQNLPINMQAMIGQIPIGVRPTMVPPPTGIIHGSATQAVPNMVPAPIISNISSCRPQIVKSTQDMTVAPPQPPSTSMHTMATQPQFPFWMG